MKLYVQLGLLKLADPRVARLLLLGLILMLALLGGSSTVYADGCPGGAGGGSCGGG